MISTLHASAARRTLSAWLGATVLCIAFATAAGAKSPQEVLAEVRAASGGERWAELAQIESTGKLSIGRLTGSFASIESLLDDRRVSTFDLGVIAGSQGHDGTAPWHADASGLVDLVDDEEALERAASEGFLSRRAYLRTDVPLAQASTRTERDANGALYDVVTLVPLPNQPIELWVDDATHLIARIVRPSLQETIAFDDYRDVDGLRLPHRITITDAGNNPQVQTIESYRLARTVDDAKLRRPRSNVRDARLPAEGGVLQAYVQGGHVFVEASIADREPALFILDTGASINVLTPAAAEAFGIQARGALKASGVGEEQPEVGLAKIPQLRVGPATLQDQSFAIVPLPSLTAVIDGRTRELAGLLGYDFFRRFLVTIDYDNQQVRLAPLRECTTPSANAVRLFLDDSRTPKLRATLDGVEVLWIVDLGAATPLSIAPSVAERMGLAENAGAAYVRGGGVGGVSRERLFQFDVLEIGPHRIPNPYAGVSEQKSGAFAAPDFSGNLGYPTLRHFTPTFDYECRVIELTPSRAFGAPELADRVGITWRQERDGTWRALHVVPDSPGARAGVKAGDKLLRWGGESVAQLTRERISILHGQRAGSVLKLVVERDAKPVRVRIRLADFVPRAADHRSPRT